MKKVHKNSKEKFSISIFLYESICIVKLYPHRTFPADTYMPCSKAFYGLYGLQYFRG